MEIIKEMFELLNKIREGIYTDMHVIDIDPDYNYESQDYILKTYRIYHSNGYCFEVSREKVSPEDEFCDEVIDGYYYHFDSTMFEGFKKISKENALNIIRKYGNNN